MNPAKETLNSSVLIAGAKSLQFSEWGADCVKNFKKAEEAIQQRDYSVFVLVFNKRIKRESLSFFKKLSSQSQKILIIEKPSYEDLISILEIGAIFYIADSLKDPQLEIQIQKAMEQFHLQNQKTQLLNLLNENNEDLKKKTSALKGKIEKRERYLLKSKTQLTETKKNYKIFAVGVDSYS